MLKLFPVPLLYVLLQKQNILQVCDVDMRSFTSYKENYA